MQSGLLRSREKTIGIFQDFEGQEKNWLSRWISLLGDEGFK